jgi:hypothetical protein
MHKVPACTETVHKGKINISQDNGLENKLKTLAGHPELQNLTPLCIPTGV